MMDMKANYTNFLLSKGVNNSNKQYKLYNQCVLIAKHIPTFLYFKLIKNYSSAHFIKLILF